MFHSTLNTKLNLVQFLFPVKDLAERYLNLGHWHSASAPLKRMSLRFFIRFNIQPPPLLLKTHGCRHTPKPVGSRRNEMNFFIKCSFTLLPLFPLSTLHVCTQYFTVVLQPFFSQVYTVHRFLLSFNSIVLAFSLSSLVEWYIGSVMVHSVSLPLHGLEKASMPPLLPPLSCSCLQTMLKDNHISSSFLPPPQPPQGKIRKY